MLYIKAAPIVANTLNNGIRMLVSHIVMYFKHNRKILRQMLTLKSETNEVCYGSNTWQKTKQNTT